MRRHTPVVETVELPSGRTLEAIYPARGAPYTRPRRGVDRDLSVCVACDSRLVEPTCWKSAGPEVWNVALWCPDCLHPHQDLVTQACADRFDKHLDDVMTRMFVELERREEARMREDCDLFIAALGADAILPEDFAR